MKNMFISIKMQFTSPSSIKQQSRLRKITVLPTIHGMDYYSGLDKIKVSTMCCNSRNFTNLTRLVTMPVSSQFRPVSPKNQASEPQPDYRRPQRERCEKLVWLVGRVALRPRAVR